MVSPREFFSYEDAFSSREFFLFFSAQHDNELLPLIFNYSALSPSGKPRVYLRFFEASLASDVHSFSEKKLCICHDDSTGL